MLATGQTFATVAKAAAAPVTTPAVAGTISGVVVDSVTEKPLKNVVISSTSTSTTTTTDAKGAYSLSVPAGTNVVSAALTGYVTAATPALTVAEGATLKNTGMALSAYGSASGLVTAKGTATGIGQVVVKFFDATTSDPNPVITATTAVDGSWSLSQVVPGAYRVQFDASATAYLSSWSDGHRTRGEAAAVSVVAGVPVTLPLQLVKAASISGTVKTSGGTAIAGATVSVQGTALTTSVQTTTDASGHYAVSALPADSYLVSAAHAGYVTTWWGGAESASAATHLSVAEGAAASGNVALLTGGSISGTASLSGPIVSPVLVTVTRPGFSASVYADPTTHAYTISDLAPATDYTVGFYASAYGGAQYGCAWTGGCTPTPVSVTRGSVTAGIDATLTTTGGALLDIVQLQGTVITLAGAPLPGVTVFDPVSGMSVVTDANGAFAVPAVRDQSYNIVFTRPGYISRTEHIVYWSLCPVTQNSCAWIDKEQMSRKATITGTVTAGAGNTPIAGATVNVSYELSTLTGTDGRYSLDVPDGAYYVEVVPPVGSSYVRSYLGGAVSLASAQIVTVREGSTFTGNVHLNEPGSVSGTLKKADGTPSPGSDLAFTGCDLNTYFSTTTSADGSYSVDSLPPDRYGAVYANGTALQSALAVCGSASEIDVASGQVVTGHVLTVPDPPVTHSIQGVVRDALGTPQPYAGVILISSATQIWGQTDGSGAFALTGPVGTYRLELNGVWLQGSGDSKPGIPFLLTADVVRDFVVPVAKTVTVTVKGADGSTPASASIVAKDPDQLWVSQATTTTGVFALSLYAATYSLAVTAAGYMDSTVPVTVTAGMAITVTLGLGGRIQGTLTGSPETYKVKARNTTTGQLYDGSVSGSTYIIAGLPTGDYAVSAVGMQWGYMCGRQRWLGALGYFDATRLHVTFGATTGAANIYAPCEDGLAVYGISGTVTLPEGMPLGGCSIDIRWTNSDTGESSNQACEEPDGSFQLEAARPGTYVVSATVDAGSVPVVTALVTVSTADVTGVTLNLSRGGVLIGRVVDHLGRPEAGARVWAYTADGRQAMAYTDDQGNFSIFALTTGDYSIRLGEIVPAVQGVHVDSGQVTVVPTITVPDTGGISGTVPSNASTVTVELVTAAGLVQESQQTTGAFTMGATPGQWYVRFSGPAITTEWWKDAATQATSTPITIVAGQVVSHIDPTLASGAGTPLGMVTLSGRVTGPDGPVAGAWVVASGQRAGDYFTGPTASDGTFSFPVSAQDVYTVSYRVCLGIGTSQDGYCATGSTKWPDADFQGSRSVTVAAASVSGVDFVISRPTKTFSQAPLPTITGDPTPGATLTVSLGTYAPAPDSVTYEWFDGTSAIPGATTASLPVTQNLWGETLQVVVTAAKQGYATIALVSAPVSVADPVVGITAANDQSITGTFAVGHVLTAHPGTGWQPSGVTFTYQWLQQGDTVIEGATAATYTPTLADVGHYLKVAITGNKPGYWPLTKTASDDNNFVKIGDAVDVGAVTVTGKPWIGSTITVNPGTWGPQPVALTYTWSVGYSRTVDGPTYTPTADDFGQYVVVAVTGSKAGYWPETVRVPVGTIGTPAVTAGTVSILGAPLASSVLSVANSWDAGVSLAYQWRLNGSDIGGQTNPTYTVKPSDVGSQITVAVTGSKAAMASTTVESAPLTIVQTLGSVTAGPLTIAGMPVVGVELSAQPQSWTPTGLVYDYQWNRDGTPIAAALTSTYTPVTADLGHHLTVTVTGGKSGYTSASKTSAATDPVRLNTASSYVSFVKASYKDFLGRLPTDAEVAAKTNDLGTGAVSKQAFLTTMANSDEWLNTIVTKMYADTLGRSPDAAGLASWVSWLRSGRFTVAQVASQFYSSDEYYLYHAGGTPTAWVTALYQKLLNRAPDAAGLASWVAATNSPSWGRPRVSYEFYQSQESRLKRVDALYEALLGRAPDPTGWPYWAGVVLSTGDITLAVSLANSEEYWLRAAARFS